MHVNLTFEKLNKFSSRCRRALLISSNEVHPIDLTSPAWENKENVCITLQHLIYCWRTLARQLPVLDISEKKIKTFMGCKVGSMRSRLLLSFALLSGDIHACGYVRLYIVSEWLPFLSCVNFQDVKQNYKF